ncbi:sigma-70 family RNA polymerase sigma factor [Marinoscillum pacificum]|uniref:sigma-70 family RNA polymerase sigma factor n=1 Tax=Marinoscillum pacificum TaxID=392723 RepID=UPI0021589E78|nr:RNA polymerase sigma factor RpoD/SigA [Marinoscillum pacificum]
MKQLKILVQITKRTHSLERYFQEIDKVELISAEEEVRLTQRIREGDEQALEKLTKANLRFVVSVAKQYDRGFPNITLMDLISEGNIGLIKAATRFDETRGFKFISYAVWWIRQSIVAAISQNSRTVRQPLNRVNSYNRVIHSFTALEQKLEREPTDDELAEEMNVSGDQITDIKELGAKTASFDAPLMADEAVNLLDVMADPAGQNPEESSIALSLKSDIRSAFKVLTFRESQVLILFYGLNDEPNMTLNDIGERFDLTRERVRQIKECAIRKLQHNPSGGALLKSYLG